MAVTVKKVPTIKRILQFIVAFSSDGPLLVRAYLYTVYLVRHLCLQLFKYSLFGLCNKKSRYSLTNKQKTGFLLLSAASTKFAPNRKAFFQSSHLFGKVFGNVSFEFPNLAMESHYLDTNFQCILAQQMALLASAVSSKSNQGHFSI
jgi:hypothetical protein